MFEKVAQLYFKFTIVVVVGVSEWCVLLQVRT